MFQCDSEQEEMVEVIYRIAETDEGHDLHPEEEDDAAVRCLRAENTGTS